MEATLAERVYNFSPGPAALPLPVLEKAQSELLALPGAGASVLEISHRSKPFGEILEKAKSDLIELLSIPDNYRVIFMQGGSRLQFSMVPMNLLRGTGQAADYILTGVWGGKARDEAVKEGDVRVVWDGKDSNYDRLPGGDLQLNVDAAYVHFTSNETIQGVQFLDEPHTSDVPLVCDASSDFLCRPLPIDRYGLIYACAQKNAGTAGVTVLIIREDLLDRCQESLPGYLNYRLHVQENSLYNTPPTFAVYLAGLVFRWLKNEVGGVANMLERNRRKSKMLYEVIDDSDDFFQGHAQQDCRSMMNVTFHLPSDELQQAFLDEASRRGLCELKGHRSVGGIRASIYNAMPIEGVELLRDLMVEFCDQNRSSH